MGEVKRRNSLARRRWNSFRRNRRGFTSLVIFSLLLCLSLFAEVLSNDKPFLVKYEGSYYFPVFRVYPETLFGGDFDSETDYRDEYILERLRTGNNFVLFPFNPHSYDSINLALDQPVPSPPTRENYLGTDDRGRDVLARLLYGFRLSVLFGFALTIVGTLLGIVAGAVQGYFGGRTDIFFQRFIEIWGAVPELYLLIIFASIFKPSVPLLLILLSLFGWMSLSDYSSCPAFNCSHFLPKKRRASASSFWRKSVFSRRDCSRVCWVCWSACCNDANCACSVSL